MRPIPRPLRVLLLLAGIAILPLSASFELQSCAPPKLDIYLFPVLPSFDPDAPPPGTLRVEAFFDAAGTVTSISREEAAGPYAAALVPCLRRMRFIPAQCFDKPVPGFARIAFPTYFELTTPKKERDAAEPPDVHPICRIAVTSDVRFYIQRISGFTSEKVLKVDMKVDEIGHVTDIDSGTPGLDTFLARIFSNPAQGPAFVPAQRDGVAVPVALTFHCVEDPWGGSRQDNGDTTDPTPAPETPETPLPSWPKDLVLERQVTCHMSVFLDAEGRVEGAYAHPDVPESLATHLLAATRLWSVPQSSRGLPVQVRLALVPETREIAVLEIQASSFQRPRSKRQVAPIHPPHLARDGIQGYADLVFIIRADGTVERIEILETTREEFGKAAVAAVRKWTFEPATLDGVPIATRVRLPVNFMLK